MEHSLFDTCSLCCYINAPLCAFPLLIFKGTKKKKQNRDALGDTVSAAFISYESLAIIPPFFSQEKSNLPVPALRWMTVVSSCWIISQEMCASLAISLSLSPPFNMFPLCVFLSGKTKCCHRGKAAWWNKASPKVLFTLRLRNKVLSHTFVTIRQMWRFNKGIQSHVCND